MSFIEILKQDFKSTTTNISGMFVIVVGALIYMFLYPSPYRNDIVTKQPIAIIDNDNSSLSQDFIFKVKSTQGVEVKYILDNKLEAQELLEADKIYGFLILPKNLQRDVEKGLSTTVSYAANGSYFLRYGAIVEAILSVSTNISTHIKIKHSLMKSQPYSIGTLIPYKIPLFNASSGFIDYALAAIFIIILHQTGIAGIAITLADKNKASRDGIKDYHNYANPFLLALSKYLIFFLIYTPIYMLYFGVGFDMYGVSKHANIYNFISLASVFLFATISFGLALGSMLVDASKATQLAILTALPIVFSIGFIWPHTLIPEYILGIGQMVPAYHGVNAFIELNQMGAKFSSIKSELLSLMFLGVMGLLVFLRNQYRYMHIKQNKLLP